MEQALLGLDLPYAIERYAAKSGDSRQAGITKAELGCFLSHQDIIENAKNDEITLILEDDALLPNDFSRNFKNLLSRLSKMDWDVAFLGQLTNYDDVRHLRRLLNMKRKLVEKESRSFTDFKILNAIEIYNWGTFAYLVNPKSIEKIRHLLRKSASDGYPFAIDNTYRNLIRSNLLKAKVVFPYLVGVQTDLKPTIEGRAGVKMDLHNIMANMFVANHGQAAARQEAIRYLTDSEVDYDALIASRVIYERLKKD